MDKSVFKIFFSKEKENKWLNEMGKLGFLLNSVNDSNYKFTFCEDKVFHYSLENLDCSPRSEEAVEYFKSRESLGVTPILASGNWVYFVSNKSEIECTEEICKKNAAVYFWRTLYLLFFAICGAILCGYHIFMAGYLHTIEQAGNGQIAMLSTDGKIALLNVIKTGFNYVLKAINAYFRIWTDIFGENDAVAVVAAIIPIVIILLIIATFNLDSYIGFYKQRKALQNTAIEIATETEAKIENENSAVTEVVDDAK